MGHPTMQENDTAKLTPTSIYYFNRHSLWSIHLKQQLEPP